MMTGARLMSTMLQQKVLIMFEQGAGVPVFKMRLMQQAVRVMMMLGGDVMPK